MTQTNDFALCSQEPKLHLLSRSKHQSDNAPEIHGPFLKHKHMTAWTTLPKGSQVIDQPCLLSKSNHPSHWKCSRNPRSFLKTTTTKTTHTCTHNYIDCPPLKKKEREVNTRTHDRTDCPTKGFLSHRPALLLFQVKLPISLKVFKKSKVLTLWNENTCLDCPTKSSLSLNQSCSLSDQGISLSCLSRRTAVSTLWNCACDHGLPCLPD